TIFGSSLGPEALVPYQVQNGRFTTSLSGVEVLFDGVPAPLIYVSGSQISAIAPSSIGGKQSTQIQVVANGVASNRVTVPVTATSPAVFSLDSSGRGPGAILNQNNSVNTGANPAASGS